MSSLALSLLAAVALRAADVPAISSLSPSSAVVGSGSLTLTVNGSGFARNSEVRWNGVARPTTYVSGSQLRASLVPTDLASVGTVQVTVHTQGGSGGTSNAAPFTVGNPLPTLAALTPAAAMAGGEPFSLAVTGSGFVLGASVRWNGAPRPTTFESATRLVASIPATDIATAGSAQVSVFNPAPLGGASAARALDIDVVVPTIASFAPTEKAFGTSNAVDDFTLRITGSNFIRGSVVRWKGSDRTTTFVSPTLLEARITDADVNAVTAPSQAAVTVRSSVPGGAWRESPPVSFALVNPAPGSGSLEKERYFWGEPRGVRIRGSNYTRATSVTINGVRDTSVYYDDRTLNTGFGSAVPGGSHFVRIETPGPGGGSSSAGYITVYNPTPIISAIAPTMGTRGGAAFTLVVTGSRFMPSTVVRWDGQQRPTTFVSATEVRAQIPSTDLTLGSHKITLTNLPVSLLSAEKLFGVLEPAPLIAR